jgi:hypothetical protein
MTHMASTLMAIEHFNARNDSVVPELGLFRDCPIQFDTEKSAIFDTQSYTHLAVETLFAQPELPCAVAGPFHDVPALELSTLAAAAGKFPVTAHRAFNERVVTEYAAPYTSQLYPDMIAYARVLVDGLLQQGRTDYLAIVYPVTDTGTQRRENLSLAMDTKRIENRAYSYGSSFHSATSNDEVRDVRAALQGVKDSGFRTIVMCMELPTIEIPLIAEAANELGMSNGDYLWVWFGDFDISFFFTDDEDIRRFLAGSEWLLPLENHLLDPLDKFLLAFQSQDALAVNRLNSANPIAPGATGYYFAEADYFETNTPEYGSGYMYDSVIATGMGACLALAEKGNVTVKSHVRGIRSVNFTGATGPVRFEQGSEANMTHAALSGGGAREFSSVTYGAINILPPQAPGAELVPLALVSILSEGTWYPVEDPVFADGRNVPPDLLRKEPEQNYLNPGIRAVGFALMGIAISGAVAAGVWVYVYRKHRIVVAAQPYFLYELCLGIFISASTIFTISNDESYGWTDQELGRACMAIPWLLSLGHIITYGALFSKLWRINKVLQFSRRKIEIRQVAWPSALLFVAAIAILSLWTGLDSMVWKRDEIDSVTGESIAKCESDHFVAFITPLVILMLLPSLLTAFMAWKTKDVDGSYSESYWISIMIVVQLEVILIALPMISLLRDISSNARYVGFVFLIWTFPMSTLLLIFGPKVVAHYQATHGNGDVRQRSKRGEVGQGVRVSGLIATTPELEEIQRTWKDSHDSNPSQVEELQHSEQHAPESDLTSSKLSHPEGEVCPPEEKLRPIEEDVRPLQEDICHSDSDDE